MSTSTTSVDTFSKSEPLLTKPAPAASEQKMPEPTVSQIKFTPTNITVNGPPGGITVAGHGFWVLPPTAEGVTWALFRPDGANYFFPNEQQKK